MEHAEARCDCATGHGDFPWLAAGLFHGLWEYTRYADLNGRVSAYTTPTGLRSLSFDAAGRITSATDDSSAIRFRPRMRAAAMPTPTIAFTTDRTQLRAATISSTTISSTPHR